MRIRDPDLNSSPWLPSSCIGIHTFIIQQVLFVIVSVSLKGLMSVNAWLVRCFHCSGETITNKIYLILLVSLSYTALPCNHVKYFCLTRAEDWLNCLKLTEYVWLLEHTSIYMNLYETSWTWRNLFETPWSGQNLSDSLKQLNPAWTPWRRLNPAWNSLK